MEPSLGPDPARAVTNLAHNSFAFVRVLVHWQDAAVAGVCGYKSVEPAVPCRSEKKPQSLEAELPPSHPPLQFTS